MARLSVPSRPPPTALPAASSVHHTWQQPVSPLLREGHQSQEPLFLSYNFVQLHPDFF